MIFVSEENQKDKLTNQSKAIVISLNFEDLMSACRQKVKKMKLNNINKNENKIHNKCNEDIFP